MSKPKMSADDVLCRLYCGRNKCRGRFRIRKCRILTKAKQQDEAIVEGKKK